MAVPYTFANATSAIPLSQLDSNFATAVTIGNVAIQLGNTATTLSNLSLANVTITSSSIAVGSTANAVVYAPTTSTLATNANLKFDGTNVQVANSLTSANTFGFKNRIINGGMVIDQRNAGATVSAIANNVYLLDRMKFTGSATVSGKFNFAQNLNSVTPPVGFKYYSGFQTGTALTVGSADVAVYEQIIEGYNVADLMFGTASAKAFTISCWVYSSLNGTFGGCLKDSGYSYSYPFTYSIPTANTWTYITINVTAPTGGSWSTTNAVGLRILFGLGVGTGASGTANNTWQSADYYSATGAVSVIGTLNATWYMTGFQVEVGTQATSFDFKDYGRELILCQRYYQASSYGTTTYPSSTGYARAYASFPVIMRTAPTMVFVDQGSGGSSLGSGSYTNGYYNTYQSLGSSAAGTFSWTATSEL
jgi:hypothetical protein